MINLNESLSTSPLDKNSNYQQQNLARHHPQIGDFTRVDTSVSHFDRRMKSHVRIESNDLSKKTTRLDIRSLGQQDV